MQPETGQVHIREGSSSIEASEYVAQLFHVFAGHAAGIIVFVETFQPLWRSDWITLEP